MSRNWTRDNPVKDAEDDASREMTSIGECEYCHEPIYTWQDHYNIDGTLLHDECGLDWLSQFKKYI